MEFQSRNRVSYPFKDCFLGGEFGVESFNLVIEYLILSRPNGQKDGTPLSRFQSRNRVSYPFKIFHCVRLLWCLTGFNLVIEYLILSSHSLRYRTDIRCELFQSRNRVSYPFKLFKKGNIPQPRGKRVSIS